MILNEKLQVIFEEVTKYSMDIPFGNSEFQNLNFVINNEITPGRALRHTLLRLRDRINALKESYYNMELENIDIEELEYKLTLDTVDDFEKRRIRIKIEQKKVNRMDSEKMINDCIVEIETLYKALQQLPKLTREQFEAEEREHFRLRLGRDALLSLTTGGALGQMQSFIAMDDSNYVDSVLKDPTILRDRIEAIGVKFKENSLDVLK